ncbi:hypothetical protein FBQ98_11930 [Gammaproteobacteria bacterium PRO6]|nr:hypothetical protein [Gammaproteobacteria bacterium PRO6]
MRTIIAATAMFMAFLLTPHEAAACMCVSGSGPNTISSSFRGSTVVVIAKVISVSAPPGERKAGSEPGDEYGIEKQTVVWEVQESFKGPHKQQSRFTTSTLVACCMCGIFVSQGETYVLYLNGKEPYTFQECSRSALLQNSLDSIPTLRRLSRRTRNGT